MKSYPRGVTTNSESGIESYTAYYEVFKAMEEEGMVLNLHGEVPSDPMTVGPIYSTTLFCCDPEPHIPQNTCVLNAERHFLAHLVRLHADFPKLRIVLEHATTKEAITTVRDLGPTVACTITAHHLDLIVDDWAGQGFHFCKPVAKYPEDRQALRDVVREGNAVMGLIESLYQFCFDTHAGPPQGTLGSFWVPTPPHILPTPKRPPHLPSHVQLECIHPQFFCPSLRTCLSRLAHLIGSLGS